MACSCASQSSIAPVRVQSGRTIGGSRSRGPAALRPLSCASRDGPESYVTLTGPIVTYEHIAKRSRFVAKAANVEGLEQAHAWISEESDSTASHNCFAYRMGQLYRSTDDGEPSGTAGRPILSAIDQQGLDFCAVLVTRYYGGTKLGTGGLARAYAEAARQCLKSASVVRVTAKVEVGIGLSFADAGPVLGWLDQQGFPRGRERYDGEGVHVTAQVEKGAEDALRDSVLQLTSGRARVSCPADLP